jgi:uroporphyrin-III C-methyltransferase / precorrin-2 dehydrogenase / sirohydrochlorin ferrochelatase
MSAPLYPLHLDVRGKRVLVVGAGAVATRRVESLVDAGADVVVVAPDATPRIRALADAGLLTWRARAFDLSDMTGAWLAHVATASADVNTAAEDEARRRGIWAVRADLPGDARTPAVVSVDNITVSVSTGDPQRTQVVRDAIGLGLHDGSLASRPHRRRAAGSVVLIGGGPGSDDLITVRGRRELLSADVIVYDRLAPRGLLDLVDPDVELIDAGKSPTRHTLTQDEINAVIVDRAQRGLRVARLKGGDPFVLGRGSEEVLACADAGIPVEVVPGVTSAISGPAAAGIPVTHRGLSAGFVVISGHALGDLEPLAATDLTLVVLMGVAQLPGLVSGLVAAGRAASTPVAIVERAYAPDQRVTVGTLATIAETADREQVTNPAVIVVGDVVTVPSLRPKPLDACSDPAPADPPRLTSHRFVGSPA